MMSIDKKKYECSSLPKVWQREDAIRKSALSSGKIDVNYYSPEPPRYEPKPQQLTRPISETIDLTTYDYSTNDCNTLRKPKKLKTNQYDYSSRGVRNDASLVPPIRQTASIFKQPVTVYRTQKEGKVKTDFKHGPQEKPKQLFWEKRLEGLRASDKDGCEVEAMELPKSLRPVGPNVADETLLQSVATALHVLSQPITGQTASRAALAKDPGIYINPEQPLVQAMNISDEDIRRQEERVQMARRRLQEAVRELEESTVTT
ncbi:hypothetical protein O3M35_007085 [Rhynocoris fuscipes]|uniref:MBD domain-containing protein n=1 Tax=Rhynocoris fuscipes TaxID=488301 RepID=A0AAW1DAR0_9HEMI